MGRGWLDDAAFTLGTELSLDKVLREGVRTSVARCWVDGSTTASSGARNVSDQHRWRTIPADWGLSGR